MRQTLGIILLGILLIGTYSICTLMFNLPLLLTAITMCVVGIVALFHESLWFVAMDRLEQDKQRSFLEEPRIPVIGGRPIDWDEYRDIPPYNPNEVITFDRNKIAHQ